MSTLNHEELIKATTQSLLKIAKKPVPVGSTLDITLQYNLDGMSQLPQHNNLPEGLGLRNKSLFTTSLKPIRLKMNGSQIWDNENPRSPALIRPLLLTFEKETDELTKSNFAKWKVGLIDFEVGGIRATIKVDQICTGIDGKCAAAIVGQGVANCPCCGRTPTELAAVSPSTCHKEWVEKNSKDPNYLEKLNLGVSPLHSAVINSLNLWLKGRLNEKSSMA